MATRQDPQHDQDQQESGMTTTASQLDWQENTGPLRLFELAASTTRKYGVTSISLLA